jgi:hypothetical protein
MSEPLYDFSFSVPFTPPSVNSYVQPHSLRKALRHKRSIGLQASRSDLLQRP